MKMVKEKRQAELADLLTQLKMTNRLLIMQLRQQKVPQNELVLLLSDIGASNQEVADVLGTTADVVRITVKREKAKREKAKPPALTPSEGEGA
jgi:hypothetical protein